MNIRPVKIQHRLYAFCIDLFLVVGCKVMTVTMLTQYLNSFLHTFGKQTTSQHWDSELSIFANSLFPLYYFAYTTVSYFVFGSTFGSKFMNYHYERIHDHTRATLQLRDCIKRSLLLIANSYTMGIIAHLTYVTKNKAIFTDLATGTYAVYNENGFIEEAKVHEIDDYKDAA